MKLDLLDPRFLVYVTPTTFVRTDVFAVAQGVKFLCPKCWSENGGPVGTHAVICWSRSRGVPDNANPGPGRWRLVGAGFADLTLGAEETDGASSIKIDGGCAWHGHVVNGEVT